MDLEMSNNNNFNGNNPVENNFDDDGNGINNNTPTIQSIREDILNLLSSNFRLLNRQVISCELLQNEIDSAISKGVKPDKNTIALLNNLQQKISDTMSVLLPLFKVDTYHRNLLLEYKDSNESDGNGNVYQDFFRRLNPRTVRFLLNHPEKLHELQIDEEDLKNYFKIHLLEVDEKFDINNDEGEEENDTEKDK